MELDVADLIHSAVCPQGRVYSFYDCMNTNKTRVQWAQWVRFWLIVVKIKWVNTWKPLKQFLAHIKASITVCEGSIQGSSAWGRKGESDET